MRIDGQRILQNTLLEREKKTIETTDELTQIIRASIPMKMQVGQGHPAKRTFQAIRIELNRELEVLSNSLDTMISLLNDGGRLCIILPFLGRQNCQTGLSEE